MSRSRIDPQRVKIHYSYRVEEIARLLGVHKNTVRTWLKGGLATIDSHRPAMVQGRVLRAFLAERRVKRKVRCPAGHFYCLKCRAARGPAFGMVDFERTSSSSGHLKALCEQCGTLMHRAARSAQICVVMPEFQVRLTEPAPRLDGSSGPSLNCDYKRE